MNCANAARRIGRSWVLMKATKKRDAVGGRRSPRLRQRVAWMYYVEEMTQSAIADALGIGRITVVRLLSEARSMNDVRISLSRDISDLAGLEIESQKRLGVAEVVVAPLSDAPGRRARGHRRGGGGICVSTAQARDEDRPWLGRDPESNAWVSRREGRAAAIRRVFARRHPAGARRKPCRMRVAVLALLYGGLLHARRARRSSIAARPSGR